MTGEDPFELSRAQAWATRKDAVRQLAAAMDDDPAAFERLVEMLDDDDTGVGYDAAIVLVDRGGQAGLAAVLHAAVSDEPSVSDWMWDALRSAWVDGGFVLDGQLTELRDGHSDEVVRAAAWRALWTVCHVPQDGLS